MNDLETRAAKTAELRERLLGETWRTAQGEDIRPEDMTPVYAANVVRLLRAIAPVLHDGACLESCFWTEPQGDMASYYVDQEQDILLSLDPERWLNEQPLFEMLVERAGDTRPSGTCAVDKRRVVKVTEYPIKYSSDDVFESHQKAEWGR